MATNPYFLIKTIYIVDMNMTARFDGFPMAPQIIKDTTFYWQTDGWTHTHARMDNVKTVHTHIHSLQGYKYQLPT